MQNPFLQAFQTPFGVPPFDSIKLSHYIPAIKEGIRVQNQEIKEIIQNEAAPTFENTIEALENSGQILNRTASVMYNLSYAHTNPALQSTIQKLAPLLSAHSDAIYMNKKLYGRVSQIFNHKKEIKLTIEQKRLLDMYYKTFVRSGANLSLEDKKKVADINQKLSVLSLQFGQNTLSTINEYKLIVDREEQLKGLPHDIIAAAKETATTMQMTDKWVFTLQNSSVMPFLQYADNRALRKEIWTAYTNKGNLGDKNDNNSIIKEVVHLRAEKANLLGYKSHSHYILEEQMSKNPSQVLDLLQQLWSPAKEVAKAEARELQSLIIAEGNDFKLEAYDWRYYAEKSRKQRFDIDEEEMKPYFSLYNVQKGIFDIVGKLYGLTFSKISDISTYHPEAEVFEVTEGKKKIGILYLDFFPRESKQGGAWMTSYVPQKKINGKRVLPVISIVCNFTKPIGDSPSLLTFDEVTTFFHEFGHALHGLLSNVRYASMAGTNVPTDFVELPSQIFENWATEPEVLRTYAKHYITGEVIPTELITKMKESNTYGQGFATVEYLAASLLDMQYHTLQNGQLDSISTFEDDVFAALEVPVEIVSRYKSTYFSHIFAGGYSSGYYSYIWSEVLDADAFDLFKEKGIFHPEVANKFKKHILQRGGSEDPMKLYIKFRGQKPKIEPLLHKRGLHAQ